MRDVLYKKLSRGVYVFYHCFDGNAPGGERRTDLDSGNWVPSTPGGPRVPLQDNLLNIPVYSDQNVIDIHFVSRQCLYGIIYEQDRG